jgi:hypothetical protein
MILNEVTMTKVVNFISLLLSGILISVSCYALDMEVLKEQCDDIGFKIHTPDNGKCVLRLMEAASNKKSKYEAEQQIKQEAEIRQTEALRQQQLADRRRQEEIAEIAEMQRRQEANENRELIHAIIGGASNLANTLSSPPAQSYQPSRINCNTNPGIGGSTSSYSTTCTAY